MDADAHDGDRPQDLYKACEALSGALEAVAPGAVDGPEWVDRSPVELSPRLVAVIKSAPQLMEYTRRRKLLKVYPTFDGIPPAAYNNAPARPEGHINDYVGPVRRRQLSGSLPFPSAQRSANCYSALEGPGVPRRDEPLSRRGAGLTPVGWTRPFDARGWGGTTTNTALCTSHSPQPPRRSV